MIRLCFDCHMRLLHEIRQRARHVVLPVLGVCAFGYFAYHAIQGDRGLIAYMRLTQQIDEARVTLAKVRDERRRVEAQVALLQPAALDRDMLDERARAMLNLVRPDEVVIFIAEPEPPRPDLLATAMVEGHTPQ
jgi:cell division protein FtsB